MLHRGDWYHKQGAASDLCTAEWLKLDAEEQALFVKVQTLEDLGDQVSSAPSALLLFVFTENAAVFSACRRGCTSSSTISCRRRSSCRRSI